MQLLDLTLPTPEENLALDEALLDLVEASPQPLEVLRLWEPADSFVVVGRASEVEVEVNREACQHKGLKVLRRTSGGAAIVAGPGCLMYAVVLSHQLHPETAMIDEAHRYVLGTLAGGLAKLVPTVARKGISDLTIDGRLKFSGNSLRCKRRSLLYHGTLLYDFPLAEIGECLRTPPRQPEYRDGRPHDAFVANLPVSAADLRQAVVQTWRPQGDLRAWPRAATAVLAREKYASDEWNLRR